MVTLYRSISHKHKGFTLIEVLVAVSIITVILSILIQTQAGYARRLNLSAQAYKILAYVRQAQVYGLGVKADSTGSFQSAYGVSVSTEPNNNRLVFFADKNLPGNTKDYMDPGEEIDTQLFDKEVFIELINSVGNCSPNVGTIVRADFVFTRPNPRGNIVQSNTSQQKCLGGAAFRLLLADPVLPPDQNKLELYFYANGFFLIRKNISGG